MELVYPWQVVALSAAVVAAVCALVADIMPPNLGAEIKSLQPVLRDNFWLTTHVLTIVSSYAAFALALGLANLSLGLFILAPGRTEMIRRLTLFIYRAIQLGVLLIAAGTILGGVWADVSWGRFWGWDPKEVWALIVLLVYLAILHGRFAGWIGPFGLAAGAVLGFVAVIMAWYGVNFVLGAGLHSYGFGEGGRTEVFVAVMAQLAVLGLGWWRKPRAASRQLDRGSLGSALPVSEGAP
jgi:ABC-type transport system involved in cytochrome c biogenesis permease subunit